MNRLLPRKRRSGGCRVYLAQGVAIRPCLGPHTRRRGIYKLHETADDGLLGVSCTGDGGALHLERLAIRARKKRRIPPDLDSGRALARLLRCHESPVATPRARHVEC